MKTYKTITEPQRQVKVEDKIVCDLCGKQGEDGHDWKRGLYDVAETTVQLRNGTRFPEGADITEYDLDICPECFEDKLIPWFKSQGGTVRKKEIDY